MFACRQDVNLQNAHVEPRDTSDISFKYWWKLNTIKSKQLRTVIQNLEKLSKSN